MENYKYYPSGLLQALTKLGGLLAILKIGFLINFMHKYWFKKEISQKMSKAGEGSNHPNEAQKIYSIENFNAMML